MALTITCLVASNNVSSAAEFLVLPGTESLAILGEIESSDLEKFERHLSKGVTEVILSSEGGNLDAAWEMGEAISANGIATRLVDDTECASACSIIFLHGAERYMSESARVGVHLPYFAATGVEIEDVCVSLLAFRDQALADSKSFPSYFEAPTLYEYEVSNLLFNQEVDALIAIELLKNGRDFGELARVLSEGPSGPRGGYLGWVGIGVFLEPFEKAMIRLKVGEYSPEPVKTRLGWHIVRLHNVRRASTPIELNDPAFDAACLTATYQVGALEFLRLGELIREAGGTWDLLRLIVTTPSEGMYWIDSSEALELGIASR